MLDAIRAMLGSKKFVAAVAGTIVAATAKYGLELDTEAVATVIAPIIAYILGQGVSDFGKEGI